jgi:hypothetical protein
MDKDKSMKKTTSQKNHIEKPVLTMPSIADSLLVCGMVVYIMTQGR